MKRRSVPLFRIGLFVLIGFVVLMIFIFAIGSQEKLFSRTSYIHAKFATVSGLKSGAQVQLAGIGIGSVTDIELPKTPTDSVKVTMKIVDKAMPLVRQNSRAKITTEGLIGDKIIMIENGKGPSPEIAEGQYIYGEEPTDYSKYIDTLQNAVRYVNQLTEEATLMVQGLRRGEGTVGKLLTDDQLYRDIAALAADSRATMIVARERIDRVGLQIEGLTVEVENVVGGIKRGEGSMGKLLKDEELYNDLRATSQNIRNSSLDLRDALAKISLGSGRFSEAMEALKHNFLLKPYFEERGYWDAPQFELSIDRKIDSLNKLQIHLEKSLENVKASQ